MSRGTKKKKRERWTKVASFPQFQVYRSANSVGLFQIRLRGSGNYLRRRYVAPSIPAALEMAPEVAGLGRRTDGTAAIAMQEAFDLALSATNRRERSRQDWLRAQALFLRWLAKHHPLCTEWGVLTRQMVRQYMAVYSGRSANYRRLQLQPVTQTAGFMAREFGFRNVGERLGIGSKLKTTPRLVYVEDVVALADHARTHYPHLEVGACLQGLAGLQMLEALRLTWDQVDLERGLVEISGEVKNEYRNRVIPVAGRVVDALRRASQNRPRGGLLDLRDKVVVGERGRPYGDFSSYSGQMRRLIRSWNPACDWAPKDLRNCLPTLAAMQGISGAIWEQYIGHAARGVTARHYLPRLTSRTSGEQSALLAQMELFRRLVVQPLEQAMGTGENLQLFATHPVGVQVGEARGDAASLVV